MKQPFNVIFMGTPDFAVPCLNALNEYGCKVSLVVTQPDKPKGRGRKLAPPPVKTAAQGFGYPVAQPVSVKTDEFYEQMVEMTPDLLVVVAFGHVLPKRVLDIPVLGAVNVHASLLPKYRGPAPIHRAIINGETETGVTTMLMDKGLDTGEILLAKKCPVEPDDTAESLHDRLAVLGAEVLKKTLKGFEDQSLRPTSQNHAEATYAPLLSKKDGRIDWSRSSQEIERFIRGMSPWPGAFTDFNERRLKIFNAEIQPAVAITPSSSEAPGTVINGFTGELRVRTGDGALSILEIQGASGKRLTIGDFLRGCPIPPGTVFS